MRQDGPGGKEEALITCCEIGRRRQFLIGLSVGIFQASGSNCIWASLNVD
jgi:hypothetical protein